MSEIAMRTTEMKVSVAVAAAVIAQSALALMWAGAAAERLAQLERRPDRSAELVERTARVEEQVTAMRASLARIETKIDGAAQ
jgi:membrane protein implicated in regulation of membrane protease activity